MSRHEITPHYFKLPEVMWMRILEHVVLIIHRHPEV